MTIKDLTVFLNELDFSKEACDYFSDTFGRLLNFNCIEVFESIENTFFNDEDISYKQPLELLAEKSGIHIHTVNAIFLIYASKTARKVLEEKGFSEEIIRGAFLDMLWKSDECKLLHGFYGLTSIDWHRGIFKGKTIKLGRLQFNFQPFEYESYKNIKKGDSIISCHIPSGGPMTREAVLDSLSQAYDHFGFEGEAFFYCHSWLLYPPHRKLFTDGSNLANFYDSFDVFHQEETDNIDFWRIFYCDKDTDLDSIVPKTGLQERFLEYLKNGNKMGRGSGFICFKK